MADITQDIRIDAPRAKVHDAITGQEGLAAWWTKGSTVDGDRADFRFDGGGMGVGFRFDDRSPEKVSFTCISNHNNPEWQDTTMLFALTDDQGATKLHFVHDKWPAADTDSFKMCVGGWDHFLNSLKAYVETGAGTPNPG